MGEILVILVNNYFSMLLHKFNLYNLIYDSLKFQASNADVQSISGHTQISTPITASYMIFMGSRV